MLGRFPHIAALVAACLLTWFHATTAATVPTETPYLSFAGSNDHVVVGNHEAHKPHAGSYTWEFWARPSAAATGWNLAIEFTGSDRYYVGFNVGNGWNFVVTSDGSRTDSNAHRWVPLVTERWLFVQAVLNRATGQQTLRVYDPASGTWDTAQVTPASGETAPTGTLYFSPPSSTFWYHGGLQQMRFWSKARTIADAESDMHLELEGNETDLAGYWPMNDLAGDTVSDQTANQHHGEITGNPRWAGFWESQFEPIEAPFALDFGDGTGQDDGEGLLMNFPDKFSLTEDALRYAPTRNDALSSSALAVAENYLGRQNFVAETEIVLNRFGGAGGTRAGIAVLGGPHSVENPFDSAADTGFYGLTWVPASDEETSLLEIRKGFGGTLLASVEWEGPSPVGAADVPDGPGEGVIFWEDFEDVPAAEAAWSRGGSTDIWEFGPPAGGPGSAHGGQNVAGTGLGVNDQYPSNTEAWLRSPPIDLTGAEGFIGLSFWEYLDVDDEFDQDGFFHFTTVSVLDAGTLELIAELSRTAAHTDDWRLRRLQLPEEALGRQVVLEFYLESDSFLGNTFDGWFIDDVAVAGLAAIKSHLLVEAEYRPTGALDLIFTMTAEDDYSQTLVGTDPNPLTGGNLFGVGGQLVGTGWEFDFLNFSLDLGVRALPLTMAPANFAFGSAENRVGGESFFFNAQGDWSLQSNALRIEPSAAGPYNSLAATQIGNFQPGEAFFIRSRIALADFESLDAGQRVGLLLFGDEDPETFDPENDATFYSLQFDPHSNLGARLVLRQGMDGAILDEISFASLSNPPVIPSESDPQASIGVTYTFEFHGHYNMAGDLQYVGILSDDLGGEASVSGVIASPPSGNHFGFGARHAGTNGPVWDVRGYDWINFLPVVTPFEFAFGQASGRDSDEQFFKAGARPFDWNLEDDSLRLGRPFRSAAGFEVSGAITSVGNYSFGEDFAIRSTLVPALVEERPVFLRFMRSTDIINVGSPNAAKPGPDSYSWEFWARVPSGALGWNLPIEFTGGDRYYVGTNAANGWNFVVTSNGTRTDSNADRWLPHITDRWIFLQAVIDRDTSRQILRLYDPVEDTWHEAQTTPATGHTIPAGTLYFSSPSSTFWYQGDLHEIRFWRQARTRADAEGDMHQSLQGNEPNLEGYWPMNEGTGTTVFDQTMHANHGNFASGAAPEWIELETIGLPADIGLAQFGAFPRFDGTNDLMSVPGNDAVRPGAGSYSWEFWARVDPQAFDWNLAIEYPGTGRYYVGYNSSTGWNFVVTSDGSRTDTNANQGIGQITGRWVFVQAVLDRGSQTQTLRVYDPLEDTWEQAQVTPGSGATNPTGPSLFIPSSAFRFEGDLQEMRFWRAVRTQADAQNDMFAVLNGDEPDLEGYWRMNIEGATVADLANGNHATVQGEPQWLPFEPIENVFGFGLGALGQGVHQGMLASVFDSSFSLQWLPAINQDGGALVLGRPGAEPGAPMVPVARLDLSEVSNAPQFETGARYTLALAGFFQENGNLGLVGILSDDLGRTAEITHLVHQPAAFDPGDWFGMAARLPEGSTQLDWEGIEMSTPAQFGIEPPEFDMAGYEMWLSQHFTPAERDNPDISGPWAAPAGDDIFNFVKYALGLDPWTYATVSDLARAEMHNGRLRLTYAERVDAPDVGYLPQLSEALLDWDEADVVEVGRTIHPELEGFDLVTVEADVPPETIKAFLRILVIQQ